MPKTDWYKDLVFYQIWPRSFCDGDGDGIGDLTGVLGKLDYIRSLGVNALWFSPLYPSPQDDYGYDIADYCAINPEYGTLAQFQEVLEKAHALGMKVIMDLVLNHTSNQHAWFLESLHLDSPKADWYIWRRGTDKKPPNNWTSTFPGPGWEKRERYNADGSVSSDAWYYLHLFAVEQPDLNHDCPALREALKDVQRFWLDMGVDGFREDVITYISKKEGLPNGFPLMPAGRGMEHFSQGPNLRKYLAEYRTVVDEYDAMTVGEAPGMTPQNALRYIDQNAPVLDLMFHFQHMTADCIGLAWVKTRFSLRKLKKVFNAWQQALRGRAWNTLYLENHDQPRVLSRFGCTDTEELRVASGKALAAAYLLQQGTPFIYQGQEIGMTNLPPLALEEYPDVVTHNTYDLFRSLGFSHKRTMAHAAYAARDNARSPVQWSSAPNAGFTTAEKPWFMVNPNYKTINVANALADPNGLPQWYKQVLALRSVRTLFRDGTYRDLCPRSQTLYMYTRELPGEQSCLVVISFSKKVTQIQLPKAIAARGVQLVLDSTNNAVDATAPPTHERNLTLKPYQVQVYFYQ
ncbi:MAG: alpha-glucosidase [Oscillospiraceae bacterium]|jgi:oligo-1,6-glucosidase|nr:alpha-glucosidase [Oscillospiraceae bacterium]